MNPRVPFIVTDGCNQVPFYMVQAVPLFGNEL